MNISGTKQIVQKLGGMITKNSPTILTGLGVAGLVTTTVMAVKATPKALQILEEERKIREEEAYEKLRPAEVDPITPLETLKLTYKCYIPTAIMGGVTIACIIGANSINLKRNAALAGLYSLSETALKEYKDKVVKTLGKDKANKVKDEINKDKVNNTPVRENDIIYTGKGDTLCFDAFTGRYFKSDIEQIRKVINDVSYRLMSEMILPLNEVYQELGLPVARAGDMIGWHVDGGRITPYFTTLLTEDGKPCLVLDYEDDPIYINRD